MSDLSARIAPASKSSRKQSSSRRPEAKPRKRKAWGTLRKSGKIIQAKKINELRKALLARGYQLSAAGTAEALGLRRNTLWAIFNSQHRYSGLSAKTIRRMLSARGTPKSVKKILEQYLRERLAGLHGHNRREIEAYRLSVGLKLSCAAHHD
jgi:ABC-type uncharacterized transport system ATPase component